MFKTRQYLLPLVLLTTITLSSSNVLPILINKVDSDSLLDDQDSDNTFNSRQTRINPNIFYKVFIGTSKDNVPKKSQVSRLKYLESDNNPEKRTFNGLIENEDNYDDEDFRKEQWHNYPRQLDRLHKNLYIYKILEKILDTNDLERPKRVDKTRNDVYQYSSDDILGNFSPDVIAGPLLILKIRLAYLSNNLRNRDSNKYIYTDLNPSDITLENDEITREENALLENDDKSNIAKKKRNGKLTNADIQILENSSNEKKTVKKRIFSLWSRLQSLSHKGHELHHRRHMYAFYGLPEDGGGTLTAETRATMMRPPGSPLRWG